MADPALARSTAPPTAEEQFRADVANGLRVLTLGTAIAVGVAGTVSRRLNAGALVSRLEAGAAADSIAFALADVDAAALHGPDPVVDRAIPLHAAVYRAKPSAQALIVLRSPRLASWALAQRPLPVRYFQMFSYTKVDAIPVAAPAAEDVAAAIAAHPDTPAVLLADGRTAIWGPAVSQVVRRVLSLEEAAYVTGLAERLGGAKDYPAAVRHKIYDSLQAQAKS